MNYQETTEYLFNSTPVFEKIGAKAYKPGLQTTHELDEHLVILIVNIRLYILPVPTARVPALIR